jgi:hypothetical protein
VKHNNQNNEAQDFELQAKIPGIGELTLKLYPDAWAGLLKSIQNPWHWLMVGALLTSMIGAKVLGPVTLPTLQPPRNEMPTQK